MQWRFEGLVQALEFESWCSRLIDHPLILIFGMGNKHHMHKLNAWPRLMKFEGDASKEMERMTIRRWEEDHGPSFSITLGPGARQLGMAGVCRRRLHEVRSPMVQPVLA
jgi:hypothetical protein